MNTEIKSIREKLGLTQEAFAYRLGVSVQTITKWETGKHKPSNLAVQKIKQFGEQHERN